MPQLRNAAACRRAVNEALAWLKAQCGSEQAWMARSQPLQAYHKVPYLLAAGGGSEECRQALIWIQANLLTPEGDLLAAPPREGQPSGPVGAVREKAWIALAAQISGRFDISLPLVRILASQQGNVTGGVYDVEANGRRAETAEVRTLADFSGLIRARSRLVSTIAVSGPLSGRTTVSQTSYRNRDASGPCRPAFSEPFGRSRGALQ